MTKEEVIKRIAELTDQKRKNEILCEQSKNNANACSGAIQELTNWLKKLELKINEKEDLEKAKKEADKESEQEDAA